MDLLVDPPHGTPGPPAPQPTGTAARGPLLPWRPRPLRTPDTPAANGPPHQSSRAAQPDPTVLHLYEVEEGVLLASTRPRGAMDGIGLARSLPLEGDRLLVVTVGEIAERLPELARQLRPWIHRGWESLRLVTSRAAAPLTAAPAQHLADLLDVEVVAPDGNLVVVPGGSLFVAGSRDSAGPGAWWRFRPGQPPVHAGTRFPKPYWESDLAGFTDPGVPGLIVEQVPAGLWVRRPGKVTRKDLAYSVPMETQWIALLVSRPGDPPLPALDFIRLAAALPEALRDQLIAVPYGDEPVDGFPLGAVMATAFERDVRVRNGVALQMNQYRRKVLTIDRRGIPGWMPFVREFRWQPGGRTGVPCVWMQPAAGLVPVGPGQLVLNRDWLVELVAAGLWIRPADAQVSERARRIPVDSGHCMVVVSAAPGGRRQRPPWRSISRLLRALPDDARGNLLLAVPTEAGEQLAFEAARACGRELGNRPVQMLGADGVLVPRYVALPLNWLLALLGRRPPVVRLGDRVRSRYASHRAARQVSTERGPVDAETARLLTFVDRIRRTPSWDGLVGTTRARHGNHAVGDRLPAQSPRVPDPDGLPDQRQPAVPERLSRYPLSAAAIPAPLPPRAPASPIPVAGRRVPPAPVADSGAPAVGAPVPADPTAGHARASLSGRTPLDPPRTPIDGMQVVTRAGRHRSNGSTDREPSVIQPKAAARSTHQARHQAQA